MKHLMIVFSIFALPFLSSCSFIQPVDQVTLSKQVQLITSITRTTTYFALKESIKYTDTRLSVAKKMVEVIDNIQSSSTADLNSELVTQFLSQYFSADYALLLQNALDILFMYYDPKIDVGATVGPDNLARLQAFLTGVRLGASLTIAILEPNRSSSASPLYYRDDS